MKKHAVGLWVMGLVLALAWPAGSQGVSGVDLAAVRQEGAVTLYHSGSTSATRVLLEGFMKTYPFITATQHRDASTKLIEKFLAEYRGGKGIADIIQMAEVPVLMEWKKRGLLMKWDSPQGRLVPQPYKDPGYWYAGRFASLAIVVNNRFIPKGTIQGYADLVKPEFIAKWKGKVTGSDPRFRGTGVEQFWAMREHFGRGFWEKFVPLDIRWASGGAQEEAWLSTGEAVVSIGLVSYRAAEAIDKGVPLEIVWPKEGTVPEPVVMGIAANAPHPNAAKLFFEFLLSREGQALVVQGYGGMSHRKDLVLAHHPQFGRIKFIPVDYEKFGNVDRRQLLDEWRQIFGK